MNPTSRQVIWSHLQTALHTPGIARAWRGGRSCTLRQSRRTSSTIRVIGPPNRSGAVGHLVLLLPRGGERGRPQVEVVLLPVLRRGELDDPVRLAPLDVED